MRYAVTILLTVLFLTNMLTVHTYAQENPPKIQINVEQIGQRKGSFALEESHRWILRCTLPETEASQSYSIVQTLPPSLTIDADTVSVEFFPDLGAPILLNMESEYTLTSGSVFVDKGEISDRISLCLTELGSVLVQPGGELRVTYEAVLNKNAPMGTQILSYAQLNRESASGQREVCLSDPASVYTGALRILLTDSGNRPQLGARFMLARPAGESDLLDPSEVKEHLDIGDDAPISVVYESFYTSFSGGKTSSVETDHRGEAAFFGLPFGTYYLVRIDIPAEPVKVTVDETSHLTGADGWTDAQGCKIDRTVRIESREIQIPHTGGMGTLEFTVSGVLVMLCACILLWNNRKRSA